MRIWLKSEGMPGVKKPRFFAVVEEEMIDKNGRPVAVAAKAAEPSEPATAPETSAVESAAVVVVPDSATSDRLDSLERQIGEVNEKVDKLIAAMEAAEETEEAPAEEAEEAPAEETEEAPAEETEEAPAEEAEEAPAEETEEAPAEETEEAPAEETEEAPAEETEEAPAEEAFAEADETAAASAVAVEFEPVGDEVPEKKGYVRSPNFAEKMMAASEVIQDRYDELKNYALRFRKLKARISKKFDSINMGRFHFVKLSVAGKTLKLYLNMDISTVDPKFHCVDMSNKKTYVTVPVMLRIKSGRAMKYAKRLIDQCAQQHEMLERRKPFEVDAMQLIEEALKNRDGDVENENEIEFVSDVDEGTEE